MKCNIYSFFSADLFHEVRKKIMVTNNQVFLKLLSHFKSEFMIQLIKLKWPKMQIT